MTIIFNALLAAWRAEMSIGELMIRALSKELIAGGEVEHDDDVFGKTRRRTFRGLFI